MNNSMNCTEKWTEGPQYFQQVLYPPVFLLGLLLNTAAVTILLKICRKWTDTHIYTLNLALADFALVFFLPVRVYDAFIPLKPSYFCTAMLSIHYINMYASIFTVTCISVHRYLSIRFPFWARHQSPRKWIALLVCTLIWVFVTSICFGFISDNSPENLKTCYSRSGKRRLSLPFFLLLEIFGYLLPLVIMTFCSIQTSCILRPSGEYGEEASVQKKSFVRLVTANWIVFVVCYTPIHMAMCLVEYHKMNYGCVENPLIHELREGAEWISTTNCCLDSFGYYFLLRQYLKKDPQSDSASPDKARATETIRLGNELE